MTDNRGSIVADGGTVVMKAATAREASRQAVNLSGIVEADTVSGKNGEIVIGGGDGGAVSITGKVKATAPQSRATRP